MSGPTTQKLFGGILLASGLALVLIVLADNPEQEFKRWPVESSNQVELAKAKPSGPITLGDQAKLNPERQRIRAQLLQSLQAQAEIPKVKPPRSHAEYPMSQRLVRNEHQQREERQQQASQLKRPRVQQAKGRLINDPNVQQTSFRAMIPPADLLIRDVPVAEPVQSMPEPVQAMPEPVQSMPEPVQAMPEPVQAMPEPVQAMPEQVRQTPKPVQQIPKPDARMPVRDVPAVRVDKQVRKVNWAEIEMESVLNTETTFQPLQRPMLARLRANPQTEARAREHIRYGQSLARRRAYFAAREEFIRALLLISSSYNTEANFGAYPERFAQALTAMDEAGDFVFPGNGANRGSLYQQKILSHQSRLISPEAITTTSPMKAFGLYASFAQAQIEQSIGMSAAGSEALHALGKLESIAPETNAKQDGTRQAKTLIFYRAAHNIDPSNAVCANDLGVLLFETGSLPEAEEALKRSIGSSPTQRGWKNLAAVHSQRAAVATDPQQRNHQLWLAGEASKEAQAFLANPGNGQLVDGQWATASDFQNNAAFPESVLQKAPSQGSGRSATLMQKVKGWF